jgi:serine protease Do
MVFWKFLAPVDQEEPILNRLRTLTYIWIATFGMGAWAIAQEHVPDQAVPLSQGPAIQTASPLPESLHAGAPANLEEVRLLEQHVRLLLEKVCPATVALPGGSGVVVSPDGYILTCAHVNQRPGREITVTFPDGKRARAITLGNNHGVDAGLAKITDEGEYPHVPMGNSTDVPLGSWCLAVGYPVSFARGQPPAVRLGRVSVNKPRMLVSDCAIMGGDSGGPLFDLDGRVIGINSRVNNSLDMNIHVPVDVYRDGWDRYVANHDWSDQNPRTYMGISRDDEVERVRIAQVKPSSPAERAGLRVGDIITKFDDAPINNFDELLDRMSRHKPKDQVQLTIARGAATMQVSVELESWPQSP